MENDESKLIESLKLELQQTKEKYALLEKKQFQNQIYEHFFMVSRDLAGVAGPDAIFKIVNPAFSEVLGYTKEELLSSKFLVFVHPDDLENTKNAVSKLNEGEPAINFENRYQKKDGGYIDLQWIAIPDPTTGEIYAIARDITSKKKESATVIESEKLLKDAQRLARLGSFEFDVESGYLTWSDEMYNIFEFEHVPPDQLFNLYFSSLHEIDRDSINAKIAESIQTGNPYFIEHSIYFDDGREKVIHASAIPVKDKSGKVVKLRGIVKDITENKRAEEAILNNIKEKEILIKEIHHRVKNNLQVISSLLNLQANIIQDEHLKRLYADSQNRIKAMASIHELLYKSDNFSKIDYSQYLQRLVMDLLISLHGEKNLINIEMDLPPLMLDLDIAVPMGLMVNEIVTNSLKHGIERNSKGTISIKLIQFLEDYFELRIGDSGPGFNFLERLDTSETLGLMLIDSLSKQIGGTIEYVPQLPGSNYVLQFKYPHA